MTIKPSLKQVHVREIVPKDYVFAQMLRNSDKTPLLLFPKLIRNSECLDTLTRKEFIAIKDWISENLLQETIMRVEDWLKVAFALNKERWDSGIDWIESQPISKVLAMVDIQKELIEAQKKRK